MTRKRSAAILVFDDAEVLDFAGPYEVFAVTSELNDHAYFDVSLVAETYRSIRAVNGMMVLPNRTIATCPSPDLLIVAGGSGTRAAMNNPVILDWVKRASATAEIVMSICSGARILARAGLLDSLKVTTHHEVLAHLAELAPRAEVVGNVRFVDNGKVITTGGISAGIDGSFHVVQRLLGPEIAQKTAHYMEYDWRPGSASADLTDDVASNSLSPRPVRA